MDQTRDRLKQFLKDHEEAVRWVVDTGFVLFICCAMFAIILFIRIYKSIHGINP